MSTATTQRRSTDMSAEAEPLADALAKVFDRDFGVVIGYRTFGQKEVQHRTFNLARMVVHEIPTLLADNTVSELCIYANDANTGEVRKMITDAPKPRAFNRTPAPQATAKGSTWTFVFRE